MLSAITVVGFFTFGLCYLIRYTDGPFGLFDKFRGKLGVRRFPVYDEKEVILEYIEESDDSFFAELLSCWWCFSTWIALVSAILYFFVDEYPLSAFPFIWFGAVAISGILHTYVEEKRG